MCPCDNVTRTGIVVIILIKYNIIRSFQCKKVSEYNVYTLEWYISKQSAPFSDWK